MFQDSTTRGFIYRLHIGSQVFRCQQVTALALPAWTNEIEYQTTILRVDIGRR